MFQRATLRPERGRGTAHDGGGAKFRLGMSGWLQKRSSAGRGPFNLALVRASASAPGPEDVTLRFFFWRSRWFMTYRALEDDASDYLSAVEHEPLLRITYDPSGRFGLAFNLC
jgi:hypothetical protein